MGPRRFILTELHQIVVTVLVAAAITFNANAITPKALLPGLIVGVVKDAQTQEPLSSVLVSLQGPISLSDFTNEDGLFVFSGLVAGLYVATVHIPFANWVQGSTLNLVLSAGEVVVLEFDVVFLTDPDGDGIGSNDEVSLYATNPDLADTDGDGMPDGFEILFDLNPLDSTTAYGDADADGFTNLEEYLRLTDPRDNTEPGAGERPVLRAEKIFGVHTLGVSAIHGVNELPIANASVAFTGPVDGAGVTNSGGLFHWSGLEEGAYTVTVSHDDFDSTQTDDVTVSGLTVLPTTLQPLEMGHDSDGCGLTDEEEIAAGKPPDDPDSNNNGIFDDVDDAYDGNLHDGALWLSALEVEGAPSASLNSSEGTLQFDVSNLGEVAIEWNVALDEDAAWLQIISERAGVDSGTIVLHYSENAASTLRSAGITITAQDALNSPVSLTLTQRGRAQDCFASGAWDTSTGGLDSIGADLILLGLMAVGLCIKSRAAH